MRILFSLALAAALLTLTVLVGGAAVLVASNPSQGADIYGVGAGKRTGLGGGVTSFNLSAHKGTIGHPDFGHVSASNDMPSLEIDVDVDCVNAFAFDGLEGAWISGTVRNVSPVPNVLGVGVGDRQTFLVDDGGEPSAGTVDAFYFQIGETLSCNVLPPGALPANVTQGNINVDLG
jgi:hypothetical protein